MKRVQRKRIKGWRMPPYKVEEYADCMIALLGAAWKADIAFFELIEAVEEKYEVNNGLVYPQLRLTALNFHTT